jgi:hypothetical protein
MILHDLLVTSAFGDKIDLPAPFFQLDEIAGQALYRSAVQLNLKV